MKDFQRKFWMLAAAKAEKTVLLRDGWDTADFCIYTSYVKAAKNRQLSARGKNPPSDIVMTTQKTGASCSLSLATCSQEKSCSPGPGCAGSADIKPSANWVYSCLSLGVWSEFSVMTSILCAALLLPAGCGCGTPSVTCLLASAHSGGGQGSEAGMAALQSREPEAGIPGELWLCSCRIRVDEGFAFSSETPWSLAALHPFCPSC